ncbi:hypothetical protein RN001_012591 [Aquatica leii]|uniref:VWFC domain-containing protein n=1 Tax=Aquatica leii TaxID=1421715 RepID=A0AAN7PT17_9COLE|nr:hypothetical protein RN001_012591 [Aquatica leii]
MPRVRLRLILWCTLNLFWISAVSSDCWFENQKHKEGEAVGTTESCLNCTCTRGTLVCYLRVCPKLLNPPPPNCIILHRHKTCCPELICTDSPASNRIEARSDSIIDQNYSTAMEDTCIENGTVYGPGSAMATSSLCEYCYCIGGQQTCIKPKCLLKLDGCNPVFEKHNCCPVRYNCSEFYISTTTEIPKIATNKCTVGEINYSEGSKILGAGHSACDNCYCIRGLIRCEPLACAPAILGCTPVIKPGNCCPDSYNCNGTFDIHPEINYDNYPIVSKEYAKLRKEVQQLPQNKLHKVNENNINKTSYIIAESSQLTTKSDRGAEIGSTRHLQDPSTSGPFYYNTMSITKKISTKSEPILDTRTRPSTKFRKNGSTIISNFYGTTNYEFKNISYKKPLLTTTFEATTTKLSNSKNVDEETTNKQVRSSDYESDFFDIVGSLFDNEITKETENSVTEVTTKTEQNLTTNEPTSMKLTEVITTLLHTLSDDLSTTINLDSSSLPSTTEFVTDTDAPTTKFKHVLNSTAVTTIVTTTDCIKTNSTNNTQNVVKDIDHRDTTQMMESTEATSSATSESDYTEVDLESKVKVGTVTPNPHKTSDIEALLNITMSKNKDYEDYDYNEPTLPPSLPNLRIIPFVAADALDPKLREQENSLYPERITQAPPYSLFSPPTKTEGGFVPKEPLILPDYYEKELGITSEKSTLTSNPLKSHEHNCISEGREILHRETITGEHCIVCVCFYGNMICQKPPCTAPEPGCIASIDKQSCCPHITCESKDAGIDRIDLTSNPQDIITVAEGIVTPNPFSNVIRTEKPPNLQSLIEDMQFVATTEKSTTEKNDLSFGNILELLLYETSTTTRKNFKTTPTTEAPQTSHPNNIDSAVGVGLLKLAGCNIYGRMYRVGRIISELSGPCMECRCTEIGVQCTPLKC